MSPFLFARSGWLLVMQAVMTGGAHNNYMFGKNITVSGGYVYV